MVNATDCVKYEVYAAGPELIKSRIFLPEAAFALNETVYNCPFTKAKPS